MAGLSSHRRPGILSRILVLGVFVSAGWGVLAASDKAAAPRVAEATVAVATRGGVVGSGSAVGARSTSVLGAAWNADNTPIPNAKVRLRNVRTGRIEAHAVANDMGQFVFQSVESGSYVIELVTENGKVLTVGHSFTVAPGETVATFVRLGTRVPWFNGFFANAASAVASSAAAAGVTAVAPDVIRPASAVQ